MTRGQFTFSETILYNIYRCPIIPIVFYHGEKDWKPALTFHDHLRATSCFPKEFADIFGKNVSNFEYILYNLKDCDILKDVKDNVIRPSLWTFQQIWSLKKGQDKRSSFLDVFFKEVSVIPNSHSVEVDILTYYLQRYDPDLTLEKLKDIEGNTLPEGVRFMHRIRSFSEEAEFRGLQKGRQEGRQEGLQEGKMEILSKLLKANIDIQTICKATGLSKQEILNLQKL